MNTHRITASHDAALTVTVPAGALTASATSRTIAGPIVRYGVHGHTSRGRLKVAPGALEFPDDLGRVKLTREHDRDASRGHMIALDQSADGIRATFRVASGPEGDAALSEADDRTRDGLSFDVVEPVVSGDTITAGRVIAVGQVGIPAYDDFRIDQIAASQTPTTGDSTMKLTKEQRARLKALRAKKSDDLTDDERTELADLTDKAAAEASANDDDGSGDGQPPAGDGQGSESAAQPVTASHVPAVPSGGAPPRGSGLQVRDRGNALQQFVEAITANVTNGPAAITAALDDVIDSDHRDIVSQPAWSGELWSGLQYTPEFTPLFGSADMTALKGEGWRFVTKPEMQDYEGDKADIPTGPVETEPATWEGARMAVGHDIDRAFFDFPTTGFLTGLVEAVRESWAIKLDAKVQAYILNSATAVNAPAQPSLLKAAAKVSRALKRRRVGRASFIVVNDDDFDTLMDYREKDVPAFLSLFNVKPEAFIPSPDVPAGEVIGGVRQAATVRTLPGSPIRVDAQNLTRAGVDQAFFGYWAIEQHHPAGIAKATYTEPVAPDPEA